MASKLTCPECGTVLRPGKPLPAGKKVKCPRCDTIFAAGGDPDEEETPVRNGASQKKASPERKASPGKGPTAKPAVKTPAVKEPPKKKTDDDDDDGGVYGYVQEDIEKEEEKKPKISYAPDMSIKDLRGPAQAKVMGPSNKLAMCGFFGFFGWLVFLVLLIIPALFPIHDNDKPKPVMIIGRGLGDVNPTNGAGGMMMGGPSGDSTNKPKWVEEQASFYEIAGMDISHLCDLPVYWFLPSLIPIVLFMFFAGLVSYGAIQMQNLESRAWGIAGGIMIMIPLASGGLQLVTGMVVQLVLGMVLDDTQFITILAIILTTAEWLAGVGIGVWVLMTLMDEDVIAGFEYEAE